MQVVTGSKVLSYIKFICESGSGKVDVDVKDGNVISIELSTGETYTGKVKKINESNFTIDCSSKYESSVISVEYSNVSKVNVE